MSILTAVIVVASCLCVFAFHYALTYNNMIGVLTGRVYSIYDYLEDFLDKRSFFHLRSAEDMESGITRAAARPSPMSSRATGVRYLYTATRNEDGDFIYLVDGLPLDAEDFLPSRRSHRAGYYPRAGACHGGRGDPARRHQGHRMG